MYFLAMLQFKINRLAYRCLLYVKVFGQILSSVNILFTFLSFYGLLHSYNECSGPASSFNLYNIYSFALIGSSGMLWCNCWTQRRPYLPKYRGASDAKANSTAAADVGFVFNLIDIRLCARFYYRFYFMFVMGQCREDAMLLFCVFLCK